MKNISYIFTVIILFFSFQISNAQTATIKGMIRDKHGVPLIGASVTLDGKNSGTITDLTGHFTLKLKPGFHTIAVSFIGYNDQQLRVYLHNRISVERNFILREVYKECKEVVVISSVRNNSRATVDKSSTPELLKTVDIKIPTRQFELRLLNNIIDY